MSSSFNDSFNTNAACLGVGPTAPVRDPYKTAQLVVFTLAGAFLLATTALFVVRRRNRRRLRNRSLVPLAFGSLGGLVAVWIRMAYDYRGREYFSCTLSLACYYLVVPVLTTGDVVSYVRYMHLIDARQLITGDRLQQAAASKKTTDKHLGAADVKTWFVGLYNYMLAFLELFFPWLRADFALRHHVPEEKFRAVSPYRLTSYEIITVLLLTSPYCVAFAARAATEPQFQIENACTGCGLLLADYLIIVGIIFFYLPGFVNFLYTHRNSPDPLGYQWDAVVSHSVGFTLGSIASLTALTDPNQIMKSQEFDWFTFEMIGVFWYHFMRCLVQLYRTARLQKFGQQHVKLLDALADGTSALLFEKHLIAELANENLLFWREAIKYKLAYDRNGDFEYSQQVAKVLYRTFIGKHAQIPINISSEQARKIETRFKQGTVGRTVFDDALVEVYRLLENGAFRRFLQSPAYQTYLKTKADFSMSTVFNPLAIVPSSSGPSSGITSSTGEEISIEQYVANL